MKIKNILIFTLGFLTFTVFSQRAIVDSLKREVKNAKQDTNYVRAVSALGDAYVNVYPDSGLLFLGKADTFCVEKLKKTSDKRSQTVLREWHLKIINTMGYINNFGGRNKEAIIYFKKELALRKTYNVKEGMGTIYTNLGYVYWQTGDVKSALDNYHLAVKISEETKDNKTLAQTLANIAQVYYSQNDFGKALEYGNKNILLCIQMHDSVRAAKAYMIQGLYFKQSGKIDSAEHYLIRAEALLKNTKNLEALSSLYNNVAVLYRVKGKFEKSLEYFKKSLSIKEKMGSNNGYVTALNNVGYLYFLKKDFKMAKKYCEQAYEIAVKKGILTEQAEVARALKEIYSGCADYAKALNYFEIYTQLRDTISNVATKKAAIKNELKYEYEKKSAADSVKNAEQQKVKDAQLAAQTASLKQEKFQRYSLVVGLLFVVCGLLFVVQRFRVTQKQKKIIEEQKIKVDEAFEKLHEKNKEVMDSIRYAKRIQTALLTNEKYIERVLNNYKL